jgi:hypothetical protein
MSVDNRTDQIMHNWTCRKLTLSYSEMEGPHNSEGLWVEDDSMESRLLADLWDIPHLSR